MTDGEVQETGDFELDGVTFPAAEVQVEFMSPVDASEAMFPTGNLIDELDVPGVGTFKATMINAGIPTVFLNAKDINCPLEDSDPVNLPVNEWYLGKRT